MSETKKGHRDEVLPGQDALVSGGAEEANEKGRLHIHGLDDRKATPPTMPAEPEE